MPELVLLHPRELVLQQLYVLYRGLEDCTLVRPNVPDNLVISVTEARETPTALHLRYNLTAVTFVQVFYEKSVNVI